MSDYDEFEAWSTPKSRKSRKSRKKDAKRVNVYPRLAGGIDEIPQMLGKEPLAAEDRPEEERMTRERAEALAGEILGWLEPFTDYAEVAGSYRRGRQDPGDLDVIVILKNRVKLPEIAELWLAEGKASAVNWVGEKKTQLLIDGVKVDIRTSTPRALGAALLYFTGPAGYNIGIRSAAKRAGFKLSEYGLFNRETGEYVAGATEEDIYTAMGRNYRPPTERRAEENVSFGAEYEQAFDISMACPKCDKILYPIGEVGDRKSENLMHFEYYCGCDEKPKIVVSPENRQQNWKLSIANPCSNCGDRYDEWKQDFHPITGRLNKNATQYWTMCEVCHKGFCGNGTVYSNRFCQTQDSVCNDCEPFNTYGKYRAESFGAETYTPPASAVKAAKKGLEQRKKYGRGGLSPAEAKSQGIDSGVTRARKIASGKVSKHDVRRMSAFNRHRKNNNPGKKMPDGGPTAGTIAWNLWGGSAGVNWAKKKSAAMNAEEGYVMQTQDFAPRYEIQIRTSRGNVTERIPVSAEMLVPRVREILARKGYLYAIDIFAPRHEFEVQFPDGRRTIHPVGPELMATYKYERFETGKMANHLNEKLGLI